MKRANIVHVKRITKEGKRRRMIKMNKKRANIYICHVSPAKLRRSSLTCRRLTSNGN